MPRTGRTASVKVAALMLLGAATLVGACDRDQPRAGRDGGMAGADSALQQAMADSTQWPSYGRDYSNRRFSPLSQITAQNVKQLKLAWRYNTGIPHSFEASPVVLDGTLYISTPLNHVIALDAATGAKKWEYAHDFDSTVHCCGPVNRGVAVYDGRVYMGALDAKLVALDAGDGRKVWEHKV
ncbi:MAG: PQQ-binding-like beta-propeller repeat protein, partial [Gemmatimonadales bacterium]